MIRWALLSAHYRAPLDWTDALLEQSRAELDSLYGSLQNASNLDLIGAENDQNFEPRTSELEGAILEPLQDDLNTPWARAVFMALQNSLNAELHGWDGTTGRKLSIRIHLEALRRGASMFGVLQTDPTSWFTGAASEDLQSRIAALP